MMTLGLNRPVYSFGLGLVFVLVVGGDLSCIIPVEDSRDFLVEHANELDVTDLRIEAVYNGDTVDVLHVRKFEVFEDRVLLVTSERTFVVESDRYFVIERDCDEKS
jgi:hypothetical protein